jgi:hypothetical protein
LWRVAQSDFINLGLRDRRDRGVGLKREKRQIGWILKESEKFLTASFKKKTLLFLIHVTLLMSD